MKSDARDALFYLDRLSVCNEKVKVTNNFIIL